MQDPDPLFRGMDTRIRIRTKMSWIRNTALPFTFNRTKGVRETWFEMTGQGVRTTRAEMEFLDITDSSLLLQAIHSPFYRRTVKNRILFFAGVPDL